MRLYTSSRGVPIEAELEREIRLVIGSWSCRIRRVSVFLEAVDGPPGRTEVRCRMLATLFSPERVCVHARASDGQTAARWAARRLVRRTRADARRPRSFGSIAPRVGFFTRGGGNDVA